MGITYLLDIIGSTLTFGLLVLATLRMNANASENNYAFNQSYLLQRNMVVLTVLMEDDLRHVGSGVYDADGGVELADTSDLRFRTFLPGNTSGVANRIEWRLETTGPPGITNPNIRYISRTVDGVQKLINLGVTRFNMQYWNVTDPTVLLTTPMVNTTIPNPCGNIGPISVTIQLESAYKMKLNYTSDTTSQYEMVWRQLRSISRNNSVQFPQ
jgi:hypothetical protein